VTDAPLTSASPRGAAPALAPVVRRAHLATGIVMFVFVVSHMTNHAFGLISLQAMDDARPLLTAPWGWTPLRWLLLLTFAFHAGSALWALYARRGLRTMNGGEVAQLILGLLIPFALVTHYVGTRIAFQRHDVLTIYSYVVTYLWVVSPREGLMQAGLLVGVWACTAGSGSSPGTGTPPGGCSQARCSSRWCRCWASSSRDGAW
jgi:adenylate cyclase